MQLTQQILANKNTTIPAKTLEQIPVQSKPPKGRDLFFEPAFCEDLMPGDLEMPQQPFD